MKTIRRNNSYNTTKRRTLEILEGTMCFDVPALARKIGIRPVRRAYTYLAHLETLGLVQRKQDLTGKLHFRITDRGLERLEWFRRQEPALTPIEEMILPILQSVGALKKNQS